MSSLIVEGRARYDYSHWCASSSPGPSAGSSPATGWEAEGPEGPVPPGTSRANPPTAVCSRYHTALHASSWANTLKQRSLRKYYEKLKYRSKLHRQIHKTSKILRWRKINEFWATVECGRLPIMHWDIKWRSELCLMPFLLLSWLPARIRLKETHKHCEVASTIHFHPHTPSRTQSPDWFEQL